MNVPVDLHTVIVLFLCFLENSIIKTILNHLHYDILIQSIQYSEIIIYSCMNYNLLNQINES